MRKIVFTIFLSILSLNIIAQDKNEQSKDTLKVVTIDVVTSYTPTISDAFKIKMNPKIQLGERSKKRQLQYQIFSAPVASTFIPKRGAVVGMNMGVKERMYNNYVAAGFGNNTTPFLEAFLNHTTRSKDNFGLYANYLSSENSIDNTPLNSNYSKLVLGAFYKQELRDLSWKIGVNYQGDQHNWYGLPSTITFDPLITGAIDEEQTYSNFDINSEFTFEDLFINSINTNLSFLMDCLVKNYNSELLHNFKFL